MRFRTILTLAILFSTFLVAVDWPELRAVQPWSGIRRPATQTGSVSSKVSAVGADSFSVDVQKSPEPITLKFLIVASTKSTGS